MVRIISIGLARPGDGPRRDVARRIVAKAQRWTVAARIGHGRTGQTVQIIVDECLVQATLVGILTLGQVL